MRIVTGAEASHKPSYRSGTIYRGRCIPRGPNVNKRDPQFISPSNSFVIYYISFLFVLSSVNIVRVIKSIRLRWAGHVARMKEGVIKSRRLRWVGYVARLEEGTSAFKILTDKRTGKRPLGRPRRRWEDNISSDLKEMVINTSNCVYSAQDMDYWRVLVNAALNLRVP